MTQLLRVTQDAFPKPSFNLTSTPRLDLMDGLAALERLSHRYDLGLTFYDESTRRAWAGALPSETAHTASLFVERYRALLANAITADVDPWNTPRLVWNTLKFLRLHGSPELIGKIAPGEIVEIYDATGVQLFRSLNFFQFSSYCVEDLISRPWNELYERPASAHEPLMKQMVSLFSGADLGSHFTAIPPHLLIEISSTERRSIECRLNLRAPLYSEPNHRLGRLVTPSAALTSLSAIPLNFKLDPLRSSAPFSSQWDFGQGIGDQPSC